VAGPAGVVVVRQAVPSARNRSVGSPVPRRCGDSERWRSSGQAGRQTSSKTGAERTVLREDSGIG
jgi:hypothetical protein